MCGCHFLRQNGVGDHEGELHKRLPLTCFLIAQQTSFSEMIVCGNMPFQ